MFKCLKLNDKGLVVLEASKLLAKAGSTIKPTKEFTIGMLSAIKAFQKKNGLKVTGKLDSKTYNKLLTYKKAKK